MVTDIVIAVSVAIIAFALVVLVICLMMMLGALRTTLGQVDQTLVETRKQLGEIGGQAQKVMEHTNQMSFDLKRKMEALDPIFKSVANVGETLEHKTFSLKKEALASAYEEDDRWGLNSEEKKKISDARTLITAAAVLELAGMGVRLWQKFKQRR